MPSSISICSVFLLVPMGAGARRDQAWMSLIPPERLASLALGDAEVLGVVRAPGGTSAAPSNHASAPSVGEAMWDHLAVDPALESPPHLYIHTISSVSMADISESDEGASAPPILANTEWVDAFQFVGGADNLPINLGGTARNISPGLIDYDSPNPGSALWNYDHNPNHGLSGGRPGIASGQYKYIQEEETEPSKPAIYGDVTPSAGEKGEVQGKVPVSTKLSYPHNLPWYPLDAQPWVDPPEFPSYSGTSPTKASSGSFIGKRGEDGDTHGTHQYTPAQLNDMPPEVRAFVQSNLASDMWSFQYNGLPYWTPRGYFGYGPPCTVEEVMDYDLKVRTQLSEAGIGGAGAALSAAPATAASMSASSLVFSAKFMAELIFVGDESWTESGKAGYLGRCQGDCDEDSDCADGLTCFQRKDLSAVPGCHGWGEGREMVQGIDYCVRVQDSKDYESGRYDNITPEDLEAALAANEDTPYLPPHCSGPQGWGALHAPETPESRYWFRYQQWIEPSLQKNYCSASVEYDQSPTSGSMAGIDGQLAGVTDGEENEDDIDVEAVAAIFEDRIVEHQQSPIDVRRSMARSECFEYHQIRHKKGDYDITNPSVRKEIHPNKLRLTYPQDYDITIHDDGVGGPSADMPKGWGDQLPVTHVDIKIPSEHWLEGRQYAAEYQIFLVQNRESQRGAPAVSVLIDLHPENKRNEKLQALLNQFQAGWNADMADCENYVRQSRRVLENFASFVEDEEEDAFQQNRDKLRRKAQWASTDSWDPWDEDIIRSRYFFGYEGSITEPPCTQFISWRVMELPALISKEQLMQMKSILFNHVDGHCRPTSNHHDGSVARPLQPFNHREMWQCTCRDFIGDDERKWYNRNRCWAGDEDIFHDRTDDGMYWMSKPIFQPSTNESGTYNCDGDPTLTPPCCGETFNPFHGCCRRMEC